MKPEQITDAFHQAADFLQEMVSTRALPIGTRAASPSEPPRARDLVDPADLMDARRGGDAR